MILFSRLIDALVFMPSRNGKIRLLTDYFATTQDPDRGWALAALTGGLDLPAAKPAMVRELVATRVDPALLGWSYDYVGDFAETVALIWPERPTGASPPTITQVVAGVTGATRAETPAMIEAWLDACTADQRFALLKLITGGLRIGVSARLAKTARAGRSTKSRRSGTGWSRPMRICSHGWRAGAKNLTPTITPPSGR
jgi:DNA ligase-1